MGVSLVQTVAPVIAMTQVASTLMAHVIRCCPARQNAPRCQANHQLRGSIAVWTSTAASRAIIMLGTNAPATMNAPQKNASKTIAEEMMARVSMRMIV